MWAEKTPIMCHQINLDFVLNTHLSCSKYHAWQCDRNLRIGEETVPAIKSLKSVQTYKTEVQAYKTKPMIVI